MLRTLPSDAVVVGHSFGGLMLQKYLEMSWKDSETFPALRGAVFMASGSPAGVDVTSFLRKSPLLAMKVREPLTLLYQYVAIVTMRPSRSTCAEFLYLCVPMDKHQWENLQVMGSLVTKGYIRSSASLREVFFSEGTDEAALRRIRTLLDEHSTPMLLNDDVKLLFVCCPPSAWLRRVLLPELAWSPFRFLLPRSFLCPWRLRACVALSAPCFRRLEGGQQMLLLTGCSVLA